MQEFWRLQGTWQFQVEDFQKEGITYFYLNVNSLLSKIDEIPFIVKQLNTFIIGISEFKLDSSILTSELEIEALHKK